MNIPCQFGLLARQTGLIHVFLRINDTTGLLDFHYLIPIRFHPYRHRDYSPQERLLRQRPDNSLLRQYIYAPMLNLGGFHLVDICHYIPKAITQKYPTGLQLIIRIPSAR